jgi:hypothetical protein
MSPREKQPADFDMSQLTYDEKMSMVRSMGMLSAKPPKGVSYSPKGLVIHNRDQCDGRYCPFHNPSNHHMRDWHIHVRLDKMALAERTCKHGVGHPDPDSLAWMKSHFRPEISDAMGIHGCDRCCIRSTSAVIESNDDISTAPSKETNSD